MCGWVGYDGVWECVAVGRDVAVWLGRLGLAKHPSPVVSFFCFGNKFLSPAMRSLYATLHLRLFRMGASCWSARRTAILYRMVEYRVEACCDDMAC